MKHINAESEIEAYRKMPNAAIVIEHGKGKWIGFDDAQEFVDWHERDRSDKPMRPGLG
jgi:hypothetical protein